MSDKTVSVSAIEVPGLKIAFHIQIAEGVMLAYEVADDRTLSRQDLDEMLDRLGGAAERQRAIRDLPMAKRRLAKNLTLLPVRRTAVAQAQAQASAHVAILGANRRREMPMPATDANAVKGAMDALNALEQTIELDKLAIAYYEAIVAGREPPDPDTSEPEPEPQATLAAAE